MYLIAAALREEVRNLTPSEPSQLLITGIGKLNAAFSVAESFRTRPFSCLINLGTVGGQLGNTGALVEVTRCYQRDTFFSSPFIEWNKVTSLPSAICGTGDRLEPFKENDPWNAVDMELYALAEFCQKKAIPIVSIKYVTDRNEGDVVKEWKNQIQNANQLLSQFWMDQKQQILSVLCPK